MSVSSAEPVCVLIVEDEYLIRMDSAEILIDAGYAVIEAGSADEAIAILEVAPSVRLLFSDIDIPGSIDGLALAALVQSRWPAIPIGHCSLTDAELPQNSRFVPKPYSSATITGNVSDLLSKCSAADHVEVIQPLRLTRERPLIFGGPCPRTTRPSMAFCPSGRSIDGIPLQAGRKHLRQCPPAFPGRE